MDSLPKQAPPKRLSELLQEQQDPFRLDVYLLERRCLKKVLNSNSCGLNTRNQTSSCPKILKTLLNKLVLNKTLLKTSGCCDVEAIQPTRNLTQETRTSGHVLEMVNRCSSASSITVYESSSESDTENNQSSLSSEECEWLGDSKQHSPVSVLEEVPLDEVSPFHNHKRCCSRSRNGEIISASTSLSVTEESILSASLWDLVEHTSLEKESDVEYRKTKRVVEQTKQLLFDCVRKVMENGGRNEQLVLGGEQIGKMVSEQICYWSKLSGNVANVTQLINSEFWESVEGLKLNDFRSQIRKVGTEISSAIFEDMEYEIVSDIIDSF